MVDVFADDICKIIVYFGLISVDMSSWQNVRIDSANMNFRVKLRVIDM